MRSAVSASPIAATWPIAGRAADDHLADRVRDLGGRAVLDLDERVGQLALVDQVEDAAVLAERRPEAGRRASAASARRATGAARRPPPRVRVEDPAAASAEARWSGLRGAGDGRRGLHQLAGELAEERRRPRSAPSAAGVGRAATGVSRRLGRSA